MKVEFLVKDMVELQGLDAVRRKKAARLLFSLALGHASVWAAMIVMAASISLVYMATGYSYMALVFVSLTLGFMSNKIIIRVLRKKHSSDIEMIRSNYL